MLEFELDTLLSKTYHSLSLKDYSVFQLLFNNLPQTASLKICYQTISSFIEQTYFIPLFGTDHHECYQNYCETIKPMVVLYAYYLGMEYKHFLQADAWKPIDYSYLNDIYASSNSETSYNVDDLYKNISRQLSSIGKTLEHPDPLNYNPYLYTNYNSKFKKKPHIFLGSLVLYLKKNFAIKEIGSKQKLYSRSLSPSMDIVALRSTGFLPNSDRINRSKNISSTVICRIDKMLTTKDYFADCNGLAFFNKSKIADFNDTQISELLNLAISDEVFKIARLNFMLKKYITYHNQFQISDKDLEKKLAGICSLGLYFPLPVLPHFQSLFDELAKSISQAQEDHSNKYLHEIFAYSSVLFPYLVGLLCNTLFFKHSFETTKYSDQCLSEMNAYLRKNYNLIANNFKFLYDDARIWEIPHSLPEDFPLKYKIRNKSTADSPHTHITLTWNSKNYKLPFEEVLAIMLNQDILPSRSRTILDDIKVMPFANSKRSTIGVSPLEDIKQQAKIFMNELKNL